jgi:hypothetical protein
MDPQPEGLGQGCQSFRLRIQTGCDRDSQAMKTSYEAAVALVVMAALCPTSPAGDPLLEALRNARAAQAKREATAGCYEFEQIRRTTDGAGQPSERKVVYIVARKPGFVRIASPKSDRGAIVYCENPTYTFVAARKGSEPFRLGHYRQGTGYGSRNGENPFNPYVMDYINVVWPVTGFLGEALGRESSDSGEVAIDRVNQSGAETIVEYTEKIPVDRGRMLTNTGKARFDSDLRLVAAKSHGASEFEMTRTYHNRHPDAGPFVDFEESTIRQGPVRIVRTMKYRMLDDPVPGDHEFYLSNYGLPEPIGNAAPASPAPFWMGVLTAAGGAALLVFFFVRYERVRRARKVPPNANA